eukprot:TRINITY_DN5246_c0_g1_i1.p1 TRINITY_DN5246_c0_g1~~TRINITY_DN5246_c0_g1_i1.p1  ORF type:complete len:760 (-),score=218.00 TRINITY_DN5246_c0_g1_i1:33-2312(-)
MLVRGVKNRKMLKRSNNTASRRIRRVNQANWANPSVLPITRFYADSAVGGKHVTYKIVDDVAVVKFNSPDSKVNVLNEEVLNEFEGILSKLESGSNNVVLISGKTNCFIAGADISMLQKCKNEEEVKEIVTRGQGVLNRLAGLKQKTVAAIHGDCMGGGLEVALACSERIATNHPKTKLSLPEVQLGILPGAGGTQRLPRLIGLSGSLDMMLTGKKIVPAKAKKMGLINDVVVPVGIGIKSAEENTLENLERIAINVAKSRIKKKEKFNFMKTVQNLIKFYVFKKAREMTLKQTKGLLPGPMKIIDVVEYGLNAGLERGLAREAEEFAKLSQTFQSKALMSLFFGSTALKKNRFGEPQKPSKKVAVLGAGLMGAGIATVSLNNGGHEVILKDINDNSLAKGEQYVSSFLEKGVKRRKLSVPEKDLILSKLETSLDYESLKDADMVIEAVFEDLELKKKVVKDVEAVVSDDCVFASNTSALPITLIAEASKKPENVIGMHYFSPVEKMPLLEIITTKYTSNETAARAVKVGIEQGKTVIIVKDGPGFYTTRIIAPTLIEVFKLIQEGVEIERLEKLMKKWGLPVGPVQLADEVGIDVGMHVAEDLGKAFPDRMSADITPVLSMVEKGFLGRKTNLGFFKYVGGKRSGINEEAVSLFRNSDTKLEISDEDLVDRVAFRMVNEAIHCLQDGILDCARDGDIGAVFGLGFPYFHGGPFRYVDTIGVENIVNKMKSFETKYGPHFAPCQMLVDMAEKGQKFHNE